MKPFSVFIVDDDRDFAEGLADLLVLEGYAVELADSEDAAREALQHFPAGVALIDLRLGKGSGIDLISSLHHLHPELLCVMMTAYADIDTAVEALRQGAYDYLRKPFHPEELLATLKRCFEHIDIIREKAATKAALQKAYNEMEEKIRERTRELEDKTDNLEKSETALRYLLEDVNEIRANLEKANEKLKELDHLKSMFIASMSHELRTPLNSIIGFTGMVLQDMAGPINDEQRDYLRRAYSSGKHLLAVISEVLDISKIEAGKITAYPKAFTLDEVVNEAVGAIQNQVNDKGLDLIVTVPEGVKLHTDRKRLLQCLLNYLSNAVKFTLTGLIHVKAHTIDEQVEVAISDTGIGISKEDLPGLFQPFVYIDSPVQRSVSSTGLGLYLTKKLATEILKGTVAVESQPGKGSTFLLRLPKEVLQ